MNAFRLVVCAAAALFPLAGQASTCLIDAAEVAQIDLQGAKFSAIPGKTRGVLSPCDGVVKPGASGVRVIVSRAKGVTERVVVPPGSRLASHVGRPLLDVAGASGPAAVLWNVLVSERPTRAGSRKFDSLQGIVLGGNVLSGVELAIPLEAFGWRADQPVEWQIADRKPQRLQPVAGLLRVPALQEADVEFVLRQGARESHFTTVDAREYPGLEQALQSIRADSDGFRAERETMLFWDMNLQINAVSAHVSLP